MRQDRLRQIIREELGRHPLLREGEEEDREDEEDEGEEDPLLSYYWDMKEVVDEIDAYSTDKELNSALDELQNLLSDSKEYVMEIARRDPSLRDKHIREGSWHWDLSVIAYRFHTKLKRGEVLDRSAVRDALVKGLDKMHGVISPTGV